MIDLGTGNNNKMCVYRPSVSSTSADLRLISNWPMDNKQEVRMLPASSPYIADVSSRAPQLIDIIETVYRGAAKGRGLVVSPKGDSIVIWNLLHMLIAPIRLFNSLSLLSRRSRRYALLRYSSPDPGLSSYTPLLRLPATSTPFLSFQSESYLYLLHPRI
jgi:hypothetical protein